MDIARIIGTIVATRKVPSLEGVTICVIQPLNAQLREVGQPLIATDATSRHGIGEIVYYVASGDAVFTGLQGQDIPVDAAIVGIVDSLDVPENFEQLEF
ncbi:MAG: EutN/CcmL family microcompartment protein [Candidatus Sumerlaeaceae bacterium]